MDERNERGTRKSHAPEVRTTGARAGGKGEASHDQRSGEAPTTSGEDERSRSDHRLMEQVVERVNALAALKRVKQNKGSPGADGMSVDDLTPYLGVALGSDPRATAGGELSAAAREATGDPEARRGREASRHPDGAGSVHPAVPVAGTATAVRPDVLRPQLRLPTGAQRARCGASGAAVHPVGAALGGRRGPGRSSSIG